MKHLLKIVSVLAIGIICSCSSAENNIGGGGDIYPRETTFGVVTSIAPSDWILFQILSDDGETFNVISYGTEQDISVGQRIYFDYEIWDESAPVVEIKVNGLHPLLTKPIDILSQSNEAILGNDPIRCSASFGGDYININYEYLKAVSDDHLISLVYDDTTPDDGYADLYMKHNALGDTCDLTSGISVKGVASFRISQLIPQGEEQLVIRLNWQWWDSQTGKLVELFDTGTFIPFGDTTGGRNTLI